MPYTCTGWGTTTRTQMYKYQLVHSTPHIMVQTACMAYKLVYYVMYMYVYLGSYIIHVYIRRLEMVCLASGTEVCKQVGCYSR